MKKQLYNMRNILLFAVLLMSCNHSQKKLSLNTKEDLEKVKQIMIDNFGADKKILELEFSTDNPKRLYFEQSLFQNKDEYIIYSYQYGNVVKQKPILKDTQRSFTPITLSDFNVTEFTVIKNKAITLINEKTSSFSDFKIENIECSVIGYNELSYLFKLIGLKKNNKISYIGEKVFPKENYYRFVFSYNTKEKSLKSISKGLE